MKATHIDFQHPRHLRVVDGQKHKGFSIGQGDYETDAICVAPSADLYKQLYKPNLPKWKG